MSQKEFVLALDGAEYNISSKVKHCVNLKSRVRARSRFRMQAVCTTCDMEK